MRRNRHDAWTRRLVAETRLATGDPIWPLFVIDGTHRCTEVASMPGVQRVSLDRLPRQVESC
jgi:porphobilinogen synthase